MDQLSELTSKL